MKKIKYYFTKRNIFYFILYYILLIMIISAAFAYCHSWIKSLYDYSFSTGNEPLFSRYITDFIRLSLIIILPLYVPFQTMLIYFKSKSIIFSAISNIVIIPAAIYLHDFLLFENFLISLTIGITFAVIYKILENPLKKFEIKANRYWYIIIKTVFFIIVSYGAILLFLIYLYTLNFNELGYLIRGYYVQEYQFITHYQIFIPVLIAILFVKTEKKTVQVLLPSWIVLLIYYTIKLYGALREFVWYSDDNNIFHKQFLGIVTDTLYYDIFTFFVYPLTIFLIVMIIKYMINKFNLFKFKIIKGIFT